LFESPAVLPFLVDATLPRIKMTFPHSVKDIYIDLPIPATHDALCRYNLPSSQNFNVIGSVASPTEAHRATAPVETCVGEQFWDCEPAHTAAVFGANKFNTLPKRKLF
jgi:hypothetical protein